jgi:CheY-like chemotaxis protein
LSPSSYNTLALSSLFFQDYRLIKSKQPLQSLAPLLVTASAEQRPLAEATLKTHAFDLIAKPIVPPEATQQSGWR